MIEFKGIKKSFQVDFWKKPFVALDDISFSLNSGEVIGFLGANGAGKTTSLKIMMKLVKQDAGEIVFSKKLGKTSNEIFQNLGYLPERPYFYPYLTGVEFIKYLSELTGTPWSLANKRLLEWSDRLKLTHALNRQIRSYSKGMLQRLGFISGLIHDPKIYILDEPLSGLDPVGRKELKDAMIELNRQGKTIFFSSHIVSDVEEICSDVIVLEEGRLLYQGSIESLINREIKPKIVIKLKGEGITELDDLGVAIETINSNEQYYSFSVDLDKKDLILSKLNERKLELIEYKYLRPTLEEIIYRIKT